MKFPCFVCSFHRQMLNFAFTLPRLSVELFVSLVLNNLSLLQFVSERITAIAW